MKVAWFGHVASARRNGVVTYSRDLVAGLRNRGHDVVFFYHAARERVPRDPHGIRIGYFDLLRRGSVSMPRATAIVQQALVRERPQVAHVSIAFSQLDFSLPELCHSLDIPIVATMHFPYGPPGSFWGTGYRLAYRVWAPSLAKYDAVIVFSENQRALLGEYGVPSERIHIIPNGVDTHLFAPGEQSFRWQIGASLVITYLGRVDNEKNVGVLLEAFETLGLPLDQKAVVVGDGVDLARLRRKFGRNPSILFRGYVGEPGETARILRSSDIFVLPSEVEGLSISMLEAMACGCALVATDVGSDGYALRGAGLVIDLEGLGPEMLLALRTLVEFPDFRQELGRRARERAVAEFSMSTNLDRVCRLYEQVAADWQRGLRVLG